MYLILQLQYLFNTPANFIFTGKFHTDNTQHLSPVYQFPHLPSQTQIHTYMTPHLVYRPIYRHSPTTKFNRHTHTHTHTHTDLCQTQPTYISDIPTQPTYISDIPTGLCTYIPTLAINMPPKLPNSADTPTKLNTLTDV